MKWEYKMVPGPKDGHSLNRFFDQHGDEEWELIYCDFSKLGTFIFKRPVSIELTSTDEAVKGYFGGKVG
jgi:hypothetical protein